MWNSIHSGRAIVAAVVGLTLGTGLQAADTAALSRRPNVVFILADDLGWADTTPYGQTRFHQTPHLERLAQRGMRFTRAYSASPLCSPTRSAVMTGLSPARTGITVPNGHVAEAVLRATTGTKAPVDLQAIMPVPATRLDTAYRTLAESLREAGYATGHFGKWHLGSEPYSPLQHGFDVDLPHHPGPGPAGSYVAPWKFKAFTERSAGEHIEDRMADEAVAWMEANRERPFFLNYWMFSVHAPFDSKAANIEKHRERVDPADPQRSPTYAAMIESMDDAVGALLDALDRLQLTDDTILIFTADNGGNMYSEIDGTVPTSNAPLRGGKATMYEGGTRVPCIIVWPGRTAPGTLSDQLIQSEDYYPTLLAGLGLSPAPEQRFDGVNILPALNGEPLSRDAIFQYFPHNPAVPDWLPPAVSVHQGDWKLIRIFHGGEAGKHRWQLFNLKDDLSEQHNLAAAQPQRVAELDALIEEFLQETHAVVPIPNPAFDPTKYDPTLEGKSRRKEKQNAPDAAAAPAGATDALQGWKARSCTASAAKGILTIRDQGAEPFLGVGAGQLGGPSRLRFRILGPGGQGRVAWLAGADPAGGPPPVPYELPVDGWGEVSVEVPTAKDAGGIIRLFLPTRPEPVQIDWIELTSGDKTRRWDF